MWVTGIAMGVSIIGCFLVQTFFQPRYPSLQNIHPVFFLESGALVFFIVAWFLKGEVLLASSEV